MFGRVLKEMHECLADMLGAVLKKRHEYFPSDSVGRESTSIEGKPFQFYLSYFGQLVFFVPRSWSDRQFITGRHAIQ